MLVVFVGIIVIGIIVISMCCCCYELLLSSYYLLFPSLLSLLDGALLSQYQPRTSCITEEATSHCHTAPAV